LFRAAGPDGATPLYLRSMSEPTPRAIAGTDGAKVPFFSWDGTMITFHQNPFDENRLEVLGRPVPVQEGVYVSVDSGLPCFTSSDSSLFYLADITEDYERRLLLVDRDGTASPLIDESEYFEAPRFSPDGTKFAVGTSNRGRNIWIHDLRSGARDPIRSAVRRCPCLRVEASSPFGPLTVASSSTARATR
jgi:Tol biopolymer transport system component